MKLTAHHLGPSNSAFSLVENVQPNYVKLVNVFDQAKKYKERFPDIKLIGRVFTHGDWSGSEFDPITAATLDFNVIFDESRKTPEIDFWESGNEIIPENYQQMRKIAIYDNTFLDLCERNHLKGCVGNFATGTPGKKVEQISDAESINNYWANYLSVVLKAYKGGHLIGFHEYIGASSDDTWLQYRYRRLINYCRSSNIPVPNIAITECGVDGWRKRFGTDDAGQRAYVNELIRYELGLRQDKEVVCAAIFTNGTNGSSIWDDFNIDDSNIPALLGQWAKDNPEMPTNNLLNRRISVRQNINLNLRAGPGLNYLILTTLYPGTQFVIREVSGIWGRVSSNGWIKCTPELVDFLS